MVKTAGVLESWRNGAVKTILQLSIASLLLLLLGCADAKSLGMGRWPLLPQPEELVLNAEEIVALAEFAAKRPALVAKIKKQSDAYRAVIEAYNKRAREVNRRQLQALGYTEAELPEQLR